MTTTKNHKRHRTQLVITVAALLAPAALLGAACGGDGDEPSGPSSPSSPSAPSSPTSSSSFAGECCINGAFYQCDSQAAFDRCAGGTNPAECHAACGAMDIDCHSSCDDAALAADHDPSQCTRTPERDGQCTTSTPSNPTPSNPSTPSTPSTNSCGGSPTGKACNDSDDCGWTNHCYFGQCYPDKSASPCFYDKECGYVSSCVSGCCN